MTLLRKTQWDKTHESKDLINLSNLFEKLMLYFRWFDKERFNNRVDIFEFDRVE